MKFYKPRPAHRALTNPFLFLGAIFLFSPASAPAQPEALFRGENSYAVFAGGGWQPNLSQWTGGAEYTIEGLFSVGLSYSRPLADTLFQRAPADSIPKHLSNLTSQYIRPSITMEVMEPTEDFPVCVLLRTSYEYFSGQASFVPRFTKPDGSVIPITIGDTLVPPKEQRFSRHDFSGGPLIGKRVFLGKTASLHPAVGYTFHYVNHHPVLYIPGGDWTELWHDASFRVLYQHTLNPRLSLLFNPEFCLRLGDRNSPLLMANARLGLLICL